MPNGQLVEWLDGQLATRKKKATTVAVQAGLDRSIVSKWRSGTEAKADDVRAFVVELGAPVLEAFFAAGFLMAEDTNVKLVYRPATSLADEEIIAEIRRRMKGQHHAVHQTPAARAQAAVNKDEEAPLGNGSVDDPETSVLGDPAEGAGVDRRQQREDTHQLDGGEVGGTEAGKDLA